MGESSAAWMKEIAAQFKNGEKFVIVHGGGPHIDAELKVRGIEKKSVNGFRITTPEIMHVVEMVLTGTVLRSVVRSLRAEGLPAVGITGSDDGLLEVKVRDLEKLGLVGEVVKVNPGIINDLLDMGYLPVISPVANDSAGQALNINADIAAGALAGALRANQMLFMTDVPGIYAQWPDKDSLISTISASELESMKATFAEGMAPKVQACLDAIDGGASAVRIIDGTDPSAFAAALGNSGGTLVTK